MGRLELTRVSTKGQVVLPQSVRKELKIKPGTILAVSETKRGFIVLKKMDNIPKEDMETLKGLEKAWKDIEEGKYRKFKSKKATLEFLRRL